MSRLSKSPFSFHLEPRRISFRLRVVIGAVTSLVMTGCGIVIYRGHEALASAEMSRLTATEELQQARQDVSHKPIARPSWTADADAVASLMELTLNERLLELERCTPAGESLSRISHDESTRTTQMDADLSQRSALETLLECLNGGTGPSDPKWTIRQIKRSESSPAFLQVQLVRSATAPLTRRSQ